MSRRWGGMKQMMSHFYGCHFIFSQFLGGPSETSIEVESFTLLLFLVGWPVGVGGRFCQWRNREEEEDTKGIVIFLDFHSTKQGLPLVDCGVTEGGKTLLVFFFVNEHNTNTKPQAKKQRF